mmetsp:Transcript_1708/g.4335  ORF Transcript_1708/g.4335 Transcript_1708/m.4335 type:complete len:290 (-) Transcript_1708:6757-7626(-)
MPPSPSATVQATEVPVEEVTEQEVPPIATRGKPEAPVGSEVPVRVRVLEAVTEEGDAAVIDGVAASVGVTAHPPEAVHWAGAPPTRTKTVRARPDEAAGKNEGRSHLISVAEEEATAHSCAPTCTLTEPPWAKPCPVRVRAVPPRVDPSEGDTDDTWETTSKGRVLAALPLPATKTLTLAAPSLPTAPTVHTACVGETVGLAQSTPPTLIVVDPLVNSCPVTVMTLPSHPTEGTTEAREGVEAELKVTAQADEEQDDRAPSSDTPTVPRTTSALARAWPRTVFGVRARA